MSVVRSITLCFVLLMLAAGSARAQGAGEYVDDFSTDQARYDCYYSSPFWPSDLNPPTSSYLSYHGTEDARGLLFMEYRGKPADLRYSFVTGEGQTAEGLLQFEVSFPCDSEISQFPAGELHYSLSADGLTWGAAQSLEAGLQTIPIEFTGGICYVRLTGNRVVIDNLRVTSTTPGATIQVPQAFTATLVGGGGTPAILHVDGRTGRDWNSGRSRSSAFATIQAAIDAAENGDTVVVWPGVYQEEIQFEGKAITVQSAADAAIITAPGGYAFSFYDFEGPKSVLANFVITGCGVAGIFCDGASPTLRNLTITGNQAGITAYGGADPYIVNCIIWGNASGPLAAWKAGFGWRIYYSCLDQNNPSKAVGNFNANPRFADPQNGDYHLKSRWGHYDPWAETWVFDNETSPCIDAGDPVDSPRAEGTPNGWLINIGAYGGTPFASRSSAPECP